MFLQSQCIRLRTPLILLLLSVAMVVGCGDQSPSPRRSPNPTEETNRTELLRALTEAERAAATTKPPKPKIKLPDLDGWIRSDPRSLPPESHGFTVAYDHRTGVTVTLYQFTRGLREIPNDLSGGPTQDEMRRAKLGIEQAVRLGLWQAAEETDRGTVTLGKSAKQALWSRYSLTTDGNTATSDTYVWSHANTLFKLRCTSRSQNSENQVLAELLTALGQACESSAPSP